MRGGKQAQDCALREMSLYKGHRRKYKRETEVYKMISGELKE